MRKRAKELALRGELIKRLNLEIDLVEIVRRARLTKLVTKIALSKFQRSLIPSFRNYNLNKKDLNRCEKMQKQTLKKYPVDVYLPTF